VEFKPGCLNVAADALSHRDEEPVMVLTLSIPEFDQEATSLPEVAAKRTEIDASTIGLGWMIVDDIVLHNDHIFMPSSSAS
jgi:hypothetical protein